ncbi:DNA-binding NarL/FixJ family response regulator [Nakamurella sp. UYEF19]|uniref:response regulator transcription factor n=1 Tax=Nakamurella sp. UYEF19 TaxID=1756392 RepID=UPI00339A5F96
MLRTGSDEFPRRPQVVLMDLRMPMADGIVGTASILALDPAAVVVALTTFDVDDYVLGAMQAGARGFLLKSTAPRDLIAMVGLAARGHVVMDAGASARLVAPTRAAREQERDARERLTSLTGRERAVLDLLALGLSNADIGTRLLVSEATVKGYVSSLLQKLFCSNRTQLGLLGRAAGPASR